jgi:peptide deformylase
MEIVKKPSKILKKSLKEVDEITPEIKILIEEMKKKMVEANGIGLASNQVGRDYRLFVIDKNIAVENKAPEAYINPEITEYSREKDVMKEGCLSIVNYWVDIARSKKVKIKALDENGNKVRFRARGLLARVLQHEYDHLRGILIEDRKKEIEKK